MLPKKLHFKEILFSFFIYSTVCFASFVDTFEKEKETFYLSKLSFKADIPFDKEEFLYLTELKPHSIISKKDIDKAYKNLKYKNRFSSIEITISDYKSGKHLHFKLTAQWILKKILLKGV